MLKILLLSISTPYTVDGQYIPSLFIEPEVRHDKTSYNVLEFFEPHQRQSYTIVTLYVNIGLKYFCGQTEILIRPAVCDV